MNVKFASFLILVTAILAGIYKYSSPTVSVHVKNLLKPSSSCQTKKLVIWTATTVENYDESIFDVIRNVSHQLNHTVLKRSNENGTWDVVWSYEYLFDRFSNSIRFMKLKPHQLINHFPGLTFLTNKLHLAVSTTKTFVPSAFNFPTLKNEFLYFAKVSPGTMYVQKSIDVGRVEIVPFERINFKMGSWSYLQVFIESYLVDGYAFDIGIYVLITSMNPVIAYKWNQDISLRFCSEKYQPFYIDILEKYICSVNYKNTWDLDIFKGFYKTDQKYSSKDILSSYLDSFGKNSTKLWMDLDFATGTIVAEKLRTGLKFTKIYEDKSGNKINQMFELLRFDYVIDKELNPYLIEVNMSPDFNFDGDEFDDRRLNSFNLVRDTLRIVGAGSYHEMKGNSTVINPKVFAVDIDNCSECDDQCQSPSCELCVPCMSENFKKSLAKIHKEHNRRGEFKHLLPNKNRVDVDVRNEMTDETRKLEEWFEKKCQIDPEWC